MHSTKLLLATIPLAPKGETLNQTNLSVLAFSLASPLRILMSYIFDAVALRWFRGTFESDACA